jgi:hypothetical protein
MNERADDYLHNGAGRASTRPDKPCGQLMMVLPNFFGTRAYRLSAETSMFRVDTPKSQTFKRETLTRYRQTSPEANRDG